MSICCICSQSVRNVQNIFEMRLGNSHPVLIGDIVRKLTKETHHKFGVESKICRKCCDKVLRWHNSLKVAQELQRELLQLLEDADKIILYEALKEEDNFDDDVQSEEYIECKEEDMEEEFESEEPSKTEIIRFECEFDEEKDTNELKNQEEIYSKIETTEIKFVVEENEYEIVNSGPDYDEYIEIDTNSPSELNEIEDNENVKNDEDDYEHYGKSTFKKSNAPPKKTKKKSLGLGLDLKCSECDQTFKNKRQFNAHIKKDHFAGFICDQCGKTLHSYSGFVNHRENHNPVKTLECPECGERFHLKSRLRHHMAWHSGEKPYQCEKCSKRFVHRVALQRHILIHDDSSRRLECKICGFKFRTKPHLDRHMATHTGAKPHSCPICGKCFAQLYNMRVHVQEHEQPGSTRQRRLKCKKCLHTFINKENYQEHCKRGDCDTKA